jgi:calcium-dependent protein kinase
MSEAIAANVIRQVLCGLVYVHSLGIVHRDLKLENLLLDKPLATTTECPEFIVKIIDFGVSALMENPNTRLRSTLGSYIYMAPEVPVSTYNHMADVWSVGIILYIMLCGKPPYSGPKSKIVSELVNNPVPLPDDLWGFVSADARDLVEKLLTKDPTTRITIEEALQHPFLDQAKNRKALRTETSKVLLTNLTNFNARQKL